MCFFLFFSLEISDEETMTGQRLKNCTINSYVTFDPPEKRVCIENSKFNPLQTKFSRTFLVKKSPNFNLSSFQRF